MKKDHQTIGVQTLIAKEPWDTVYDRLRDEIKIRQYSPNTIQTYSGWIRKFQYFTKSKSPESLCQQDIKDYLTFLAVQRNVAASTQNQAFMPAISCRPLMTLGLFRNCWAIAT
jgi:hypothetical protein